jgi:hypothetical protein
LAELIVGKFMVLPEFSEFTFGFALTHNLISTAPNGLKAVPIFPNLKQEGQVGGGYDVEIPNHATPYFLQFKIPQVVTRKKKDWGHGLEPPYYRMPIMSPLHSRQHWNLLNHEKSGKKVYYATPVFDTCKDLNSFWQDGRLTWQNWQTKSSRQVPYRGLGSNNIICPKWTRCKKWGWVKRRFKLRQEAKQPQTKTNARATR